MVMMGSSSLVGPVALLKQVFGERCILGDNGGFIPGDRPRPVFPLPRHGPNTEFSDRASFLPFINNFNRFNNVPLHG